MARSGARSAGPMRVHLDTDFGGDTGGQPARLVTAIDRAAFAEHWLATVEAFAG